MSRQRIFVSTTACALTSMLASLFSVALVDAKCVPSDFRLALDVGHTPEAQGATSARGVPEYHYNKLLASSISKRAKDLGFNVTEIFARGSGQSQLRARIAQSEAYRPNLLISIHHDSVQTGYLSRWTFEGQDHQYSDIFSGYSLFVSKNSNLYAASVSYATLLSSELQRAGFNPSEHHAADVKGERRAFVERKLGIYSFDELYILRNSSAPTVLFEAGIILNRNEELSVGTSPGRDRISNAVMAAVDRFCALMR